MSDDESACPPPDPEATARLLKKQMVHLRRWFERERWKIEPQPRSFSPPSDGREDGVADGAETEEPEVRPRGRAAGSPEDPAESQS